MGFVMFFEQGKEAFYIFLDADFKTICMCYYYKDYKQEHSLEARLK